MHIILLRFADQIIQQFNARLPKLSVISLDRNDLRTPMPVTRKRIVLNSGKKTAWNTEF